MVTTAEGALNLLYAPYLEGHGYSLGAIGALSSLLAVFRLASRVPAGAVYRPSRARTHLAVALVAFSVATSGFALAGGHPVAVAVLTAVHGFAFGSVGTLILAVVIDVTGGRAAGAVMGWYTAALSTGYALGAFAAGGLADTTGTAAALALLGALPAATAIAVFALPPFEGPRHSVDRGKGLRGLLAAAAALDGRVWLAFTIAVYINLLADSVDTFFPLYGAAIGLPLAAVGALKGLKSGSAAFIRFVSGVIFRYLDYRPINVWTVIISGAATVAFPRVSAFGALVALFIVLGLARGILRVTSAATVAERRSEGRDVGLASGVYSAGLDVGAIAGPAVGGVLGNALGLAGMFQVVGAASVAMYFTVALASPAGRSALRAGLRPAAPRPAAAGDIGRPDPAQGP
jgi:DHA1 family multidrug resistance protein-like MFS transporter